MRVLPTLLSGLCLLCLTALLWFSLTGQFSTQRLWSFYSIQDWIHVKPPTTIDTNRQDAIYNQLRLSRTEWKDTRTRPAGVLPQLDYYVALLKQQMQYVSQVLLQAPTEPSDVEQVAAATGLFPSGGVNVSNAPSILIGTQQGLYRDQTLIWEAGGAIRSIFQYSNETIVLSDKGVFVSSNFHDWISLNGNLPQLVINNYDSNQQYSLIKELEPTQVLAINPRNTKEMAVASLSGVFYTLDSGKHWEKVQHKHWAQNFSALGFARIRGQTYLLGGHPFLGILCANIYDKKARWKSINYNLPFENYNYYEISSILSIPSSSNDQVFIASSDKGRVYRLQSRHWEPLLSFDGGFTSIRSLIVYDNVLHFLANNQTMAFDLQTHQNTSNYLQTYLQLTSIHSNPYSMLVEGRMNRSLESLWQVFGNRNVQAYPSPPGMKALYVSPGAMMKRKVQQDIVQMVDEGLINALVLDMKDDQGRIHYHTADPFVQERARLAPHISNTAQFIQKMQQKQVYLIARMVAFKDPVLYRFDKHRLSIQDTNGGPWRGERSPSPSRLRLPASNQSKSNSQKKAILSLIVQKPQSTQETQSNVPPEPVLLNEYWVDPYSTEVWKYNVRIAQEILALGFQEIAWDYIRFPTDGVNLYDATYPAYIPGMNKASALLSFLRYARKQLHGSMSVSLYGANSWHRIIGKTGQFVPMIAPYVDIISPMYYPSHFTPEFHAQDPLDERPYRIYSIGSERTQYLAENRVQVRPWVQAFSLNNVEYDQRFFGTNYVAQEIEGAFDGQASGVLFWTAPRYYPILTAVLKSYSE